jgi:hypothetical protein
VNKLLIGLIIMIGSLFAMAPHVHAQQNEIGTLQLRAMQTRKFLNVDMAKLTNAIETVLHSYGLTTACAKFNTDTLLWCDVNTVQNNMYTYLDFLLRADTKEKVTYLRVSYIKGQHSKSPTQQENFYRNFFKNIGDTLFVESQKFDMQEIN